MDTQATQLHSTYNTDTAVTYRCYTVYNAIAYF